MYLDNEDTGIFSFVDVRPAFDRNARRKKSLLRLLLESLCLLQTLKTVESTSCLRHDA
jgi:hypothetical protein